MISVSDAARFAEESISTKKFKGWWETILDNVILGLLLLTLFSWAKVISVEASGFLCIPIDPKVGYSFNLAKYFNTRCVQSFEQKLLLYYPYFIFVLWLLLFLVQRTWMKIPFVRCRLDSFHKLFTEMIKVSSKMKYRSINKTIAKREMNEIDQISTSNCNEQLLEVAITEMRQHILMILDRQSLLLQCYITKNTIMLLIAACSSSFLVYWISTLDLFQANFHCHLDASETFTPLHNFTCNFPSAPFLYVIIFISIGLQNLIMFFSLYALYWMFSKRTKKNILKCGLVLTKARGFSDLKYCLELFRCTFQEREKIIESLSQQYCRPEQTLVLGRNDDFMILKYITDYLGLYINTGKNGDSSLNRCIEELKEQIKADDSSLLLPDTRRKDFNYWFKQEQTHFATGCLNTISEELKIYIIVIHGSSSNDTEEVFQPSRRRLDNPLATHFITFIQPSVFHTTSPMNDNDRFVERRLAYANSIKYRNVIRHRAMISIDKEKLKWTERNFSRYKN